MKGIKKIMFSVVFLLLLIPTKVFAEGSKELTQYGGYRANLEWLPAESYHISDTESVKRQQIIKVYAKAGEKFYFGTSYYYSDIYPNTDIRITDPDGTIHDFDALNTGNKEGTIANKVMENAGPKQLGDSSGYNALEYTVPETGVYEFNFFGSAVSGQPTPKPADGMWSGQRSTVAAWDITVVDENNVEKKGRVFADYLTITTGYNNLSVNSKVYIVTKDGYKYYVDFNGLDPYGLLFFANNRGLVNSVTDESLYHSTKFSSSAWTSILGDVTYKNPQTMDTEKDLTHKIFFNDPDNDALKYLGISDSTEPAVPKNLAFNNNQPVKKGAGGNFTFNLDKPASIEIKIIFDTGDPNNIVTLSNYCNSGFNSFHWDGKDKYGNKAEAGTYKVIVISSGGETHFVLMDVENIPNGFKVSLLNRPSGSTYNPNLLYYDNSNTTINGDKINFTNKTDNTQASFTGSLTRLDGVDSKNDFASKYTGNFGNNALLDLWTKYYDSKETLTAEINIYTTGYVDISKEVTNKQTNDTFKFLVLQNNKPIDKFDYIIDGITYTSTDSTISLKSLQKARIELISNDNYTIQEIDDTNFYSVLNYVDNNKSNEDKVTNKFTIGEDTTTTVDFKNTYVGITNPNTSDINIKKELIILFSSIFIVILAKRKIKVIA